MFNKNRKQVNYSAVPVFTRFSKSGNPEFKVFQTENDKVTISDIIVFEDMAKFAKFKVYN